MIRLAKKEDIKELAVIYKDLYDNADIGENWTIESASALLTYWFEKQGDLFFVAEEDGKVVGGIVSGIKPWFDGNRLVDGEIFVSNEYQGRHIANDLFKAHLLKSRELYNANIMEFHTYGDETEFPQNWYTRLGIKKDDELVIMNGEIKKILSKLK
jgi:L-amino acid N-acyltransferase YncA